MQVWLVTGVSGSGWKELMEELKEYATDKGKNVAVYDVGKIIEKKAKENNIEFVEERILNVDRTILKLLRALALQEVISKISQADQEGITFICIHALFEWKKDLIPGVSYADLMQLKIDGIINIVDDVATIFKNLATNERWKDSPPQIVSLQRWMLEEQLLSEVFASIKAAPMFVHAKNQTKERLYSFFFERKKRVYLSFPITAIRDQQELLDRIQHEFKPQIEELFYVFNPLDIMDKTHIAKKEIDEAQIPGFYSKENEDMIDARTISRDYRFISQSDAVVVLYPTDKDSQGVAAEMKYAHSHQKPVFAWYQGSVSPFLKDIANVYSDWDVLLGALKKFSQES